MVITVRAVLIAFLIRGHVLPERLLALLAQKRHLRRLGQLMVFLLRMTFRAVEPLLATRRSD